MTYLRCCLHCTAALFNCLQATFRNQNDPAFQDSVGRLLLESAGTIPDGLLVFMPSYAMLDRLMARWKARQSQRQLAGCVGVGMGAGRARGLLARQSHVRLASSSACLPHLSVAQQGRLLTHRSCFPHLPPPPISAVLWPAEAAG